MTFDVEREHRLAVLRILIAVTVIGSVIFSVLNMQRGMVMISVIEILAGIFALVMYFVVGRTPHLHRWTLVFLLPFFAIIMLVVGLPGASESVFVWVFTIPPLAYFLLGRAWGFALSLVFLTSALVIYLLKQYVAGGTIVLVSLGNITLCAIAIWAFSHVYESARQLSQGGLLKLANTDPLTGLPNRARFTEVFELELKRVNRENSRMSLALFDLDRFKRINDAYGHDCGDAVLKKVAELFHQRLRATDWVCRIGGEEFCVILAGVGESQAAVIAEDIRARIEAMSLVYDGEEIKTTISAGVAELDPAAPSLADLYTEADKRLYQAKARGRNRVEVGAEV